MNLHLLQCRWSCLGRWLGSHPRWPVKLICTCSLLNIFTHWIIDETEGEGTRTISVPWVPGTLRTSIKSRQRFLPPDWGQLWGSHVSSRLRPPPPGSGQLLGHHGAPAPTFWLRTSSELPCVLMTGYAGHKQINKYPLSTRPSWSPSGMYARIFQDTTRQGLIRTLIRRAVGGPLNTDETCGRQVVVTRHSVEWFNNSRLKGDCNPVSTSWATCQPPLRA
jgi:hypothetical protein